MLDLRFLLDIIIVKNFNLKYSIFGLHHLAISHLIVQNTKKDFKIKSRHHGFTRSNK